MDTPYYFPEGWELVTDETFQNLDAWSGRDGVVYQDTVWLDINNTLREGGGLRLVGSDVLVDGKYPGAICKNNTFYTNGYFEFYGKFPTGNLWAAFFLYNPNRQDYVPENLSEIDVFEYLGSNIIYMTIHRESERWQKQQTWTGLGGTYNKWGCYWDTDKIVIYLNDYPVAEFAPVEMLPMTIHFALCFDGWANPPTDVTFPAYFDVDWVKVWVKDNTHR